MAENQAQQVLEGMPPSSKDLGLQLQDLDYLVRVYTTLRTFSFLLRLSPFTLMEFCTEILPNKSSPMIDEISVQLLRTIQSFPPVSEESTEDELVLFKEDSEPYLISKDIDKLIKDPIWKYLDYMSWPEFLKRLMVARKCRVFAGIDCCEFLEEQEWCKLPLACKVASLQFLCDCLLDAPIAKSLIDGRDEQIPMCMEQEKEEVKAREKGLWSKAANENLLASIATGSQHALQNYSHLPYDNSHLYVRDGLDELEIDQCDLCTLGGTLICCDGCPASYLSRCVGLKRVGDEKQKWFCEECRIGGQIRAYRFLHRQSNAMEWEHLPLIADFGKGKHGIEVVFCHGRLYLFKDKQLVAYYSEHSQVELLIRWLEQLEQKAVVTEPQANSSAKTVKHGKQEKGDSKASGLNSVEDKKASTPSRETQEEDNTRSLRRRKLPGKQDDEAADSPKDRSGTTAREEEEEEENSRSLRRRRKAASSGDGEEGAATPDTRTTSKEAEEGENMRSRRRRKLAYNEDDEHGPAETPNEKDAGTPMEDEQDGELTRSLRRRKKAASCREEEGVDSQNEKDHDDGQSGRARRSRRLAYSQEDDEEAEMETQEDRNTPVDESQDAECAQSVKKKRKSALLRALIAKCNAIVEEMKFCRAVEVKMKNREYLNKYKDSPSIHEVRAVYKPSKMNKRLMENGITSKWKGWPRYNDTNLTPSSNLHILATYLTRLEKDLQGLASGPWLTRTGRRDWIEQVRNAIEPKDVANAAVEFERCLQSLVFLPTWFSSDSPDAKPKRRGRKKKSENRSEVDYEELMRAGVLDDPSGSFKDEESDEEEILLNCWIGGKRAAPLHVKLSSRSLRKVMLNSAEDQFNNMIYTGDHAVPSTRFKWIRRCISAKTVHLLSIYLRMLDDFVKWDGLKRPPAPTNGKLFDVQGQPLLEKLINKREQHGLQYLMQFWNNVERPQWTSPETIPLWAIKDYENNLRKENKIFWWREFDFHPGAFIEVEVDGYWYQAFVLKCVNTREEVEEWEFDPAQLKDKVGMVLVHYISGRDDEDEWIPKDSMRLREDKLAERRCIQERLSREHEQRRLAQIIDTEKRAAARSEYVLARKKMREQEKAMRADREKERIAERERKVKAKAEKMKQRELEKEEKVKMKEREKQERIERRQREQEIKKMEMKKAKELERERQRIFQSKSSWWKEFEFKEGAMVEMQWDGDWWDAIIIRCIGCPSNAAGQAEKQEVPPVQSTPAPAPQVKPKAKPVVKPALVEPAPIVEPAPLVLQVPMVEPPVAAAGADMVIQQAYENFDPSMLSPPPPPPPPPDPPEEEEMSPQQVELSPQEEWTAESGGEQQQEQQEQQAQAAEQEQQVQESTSTNENSLESLLPYTVPLMPGPKFHFPDDWPEDGVYICAEDDRPIDVARLHRVNVDRLVRMNKKRYSGLTRVSPLKAGTTLELPLPMDIVIESEPAPPQDPCKVGVVLVHYVGGAEDETEWVFTCSKRMRPSSDRLWNAFSIEAGAESERVNDPNAWKKHCKKVLKRVKKHERSWPFWEPFWDDPEGDIEMSDYLSIVKEPICLDFVDARLEQDTYAKPDDFLADMRLIFSNAKSYNPPDHDYHKMADKVSAFFEEIWASGHEGNNWGQVTQKDPSKGLLKSQQKIRPQLKKKPSSSTPASAPAKEKSKEKSKEKPAKTPDAPRVKNSTGEPKEGKLKAQEGKLKAQEGKLKAPVKEVLLKCVDDVCKMEESELFRQPVDKRIAPDYYDVIKRPMDLSRVRENLEKGRYSRVSDFVADMRQIFENAYEYNNEDDEVYLQASNLEKKFERLWKKADKQIEEMRATKTPKEKKEQLEEAIKTQKITPKSSKKPESSAAKKAEKAKLIQEERQEATARCMKVLDKIVSDKHAWPFEQPVDAKKLKLRDYHKIVKEPMDLSTIRSKLEEEGYTRVEEEFHRDMLLVFDNAMLFNNEGDPIYEYAEQLRLKFDKVWAKSARMLEESTKSEPPRESSSESKKKVEKSPKKNAVKQEMEVEHEAAAAAAAQTAESWVDWAKRMIQLMLEDDVSLPFREPVNPVELGLDDYWEVIKQPMDLGTISKGLKRRRYSSLDQVVKDVVLVFDNAMLYNKRSDPVHKCAKEMLASFRQELASFERRVEPATPAEVTKKRSREETSEQAPLEASATKKGKKSGAELEQTPAESSATKKGKKGGAELEQTPAESSATKKGKKGGEEAKVTKLMVGTTVEMLFDDGNWHEGIVDKFDSKTNKYQVRFSDGDVQTTAFPDPDVRVAAKKHPLPPVSIREAGSAKSRGRSPAGVAEHQEEAKGSGRKGRKGQGGELLEEPEANLGRNVSMLFDDGHWYKGCIIKYHMRSGKYRIRFEDGEEVDTQLPHEEVKLLDEFSYT